MDFNLVIYMLWTVIGAFGEEIGWRGYLIRPLEQKYNPFITSVVIGFFGFCGMSIRYLAEYFLK